MEKEDSFPQRVWQIVAAIPEGYVTTYGDVAKLAGSPRAARQVGGVLKRLPEGSTLPWHRVVNRHGTISLTGPDLQRQRQALLAEGVMVSGSSALVDHRLNGIGDKYQFVIHGNRRTQQNTRVRLNICRVK